MPNEALQATTDRTRSLEGTTLRPRRILEDFSRRHPGVWKSFDAVRARRAGGWPEHIFAPLDMAGIALVESRRAAGLPSPSAVWEILGPAHRLAGLAAWRIAQQVYRFDPDLYRALAATPLAGEIPGELFRRLPAWAVYVETPGLQAPLVGGGTEPVHGCFAWLDWRADRGEDILTLGLDTELELAVGHVPLAGTLQEALTQVESDWREGAAAGIAGSPLPAGFAAAAADVYGRLLSLLLYLCADDADYARPPWPAPHRTKKGLRWFPADKPQVWTVGERIGAALRRAPSAQEPDRAGETRGHAAPRPHVRNAHWHTFWRGPLDGRRERLVRWLHPILVGVGDGVALPTTVRPVKPVKM